MRELLNQLRKKTVNDQWAWKKRAGPYAALFGKRMRDIFGMLEPTPAPTFAEKVSWPTAARKVVPLVELLSLTRHEEPTREQFDTLGDGPMQSATRPREFRKWAPGVPQLKTDTLEIPQWVFSIWLGGPLTDPDPAERDAGVPTFRDNLEASARVYQEAAAGDPAKKVAFTLITDVPRSDFDKARKPELRAGNAYLQKVWDMLEWAKGDGTYHIDLVNVDEVLNAEFLQGLGDRFGDPLLGQLLNMVYTLYRAAVIRPERAGKAMASDLLRILLTFLFGGVYRDGDDQVLYGMLAETREILKYDRHGFAVSVIGGRLVANDGILSPAGHPYLRMALEIAVAGHSLSRLDVSLVESGGAAIAFPAGGGWTTKTKRPRRTSTIPRALGHMLALFAAGLIDKQTKLAYATPIKFLKQGSAESWLAPPEAGDTLPVAMQVISHLDYHAQNLDGVLNVQAVDAAVRLTKDPDTTWDAVITYLAEDPEFVNEVTSIWEGEQQADTSITDATLPPKARALLDIDEDPTKVKILWGFRQRPARFRNAKSARRPPIFATSDFTRWFQKPDRSYSYASGWNAHRDATQLPPGMRGVASGTDNDSLLGTLTQIVRRMHPIEHKSFTAAALLDDDGYSGWRNAYDGGQPMRGACLRGRHPPTKQRPSCCAISGSGYRSLRHTTMARSRAAGFTVRKARSPSCTSTDELRATVVHARGRCR